jgi:hypothetical protein
MPSREQLESIEEPVLLMQGNPRQVVTANRKALDVFGKPLGEIEAHRGGEVFDCVHSFTDAGCGKDAHCEPCTIRKAIVDTFESGTPHRAAAELQVRKDGTTKACAIEISTEKAGELALVRIERFDPAA